MKKAIPILLLVAVFAVAIFLWRKNGLVIAPRPMATLAAPDVIAFFQVTNVSRTLDRWQGTELAQIAAEPEVKAFLEKPLSKIPRDNPVWKDWEKLKPRGGFLSLARMEGNQPVAVLGVTYGGDRKDMEKALADWQAQLKTAQPEGKADLVKHGDVTIETYTMKQGLLATALVKNWVFVGTNLPELEATLDRVTLKEAPPSLAKEDLFLKTVAHLPADPDTLLYLNPKTLWGRLEGLMAATGKPMDPAAAAKLQKVQAISAAMKIEGPLIRDVWYSYQPGLETAPDLQQHALALTSPATLLFLNSVIQLPEKLELGDPSLDMTGMTRILADWQAVLASQGMKYEDVIKAFGPEAGLSVDWPAGVTWPTAVAALDVKDRATAEKALELVTNRAGSAPWAKQTVGGTTFYGLPAMGIAMIKPTFALTDHFLLASFSYEAVKQAADAALVKGGKLDEVPVFKGTLKDVPAAGGGLFYVDAAKMFENLYGQARPMLMLYASFSKELSDYADASKLPEPAVIAKHLTPIIYTTGKTSDGGYFGESAGPLTASQSLIVIGGAAGVAAVPFIKNYLPNLNAGALPRVLSPTLPVPAPNAVVPPAPATPSSAPTGAPAGTPEPTAAQ